MVKSLVPPSGIRRFYAEERPNAVARLGMTRHSFRLTGYRIAKIGTTLEREIVGKLQTQHLKLEAITTRTSNWLMYYQEACRYWCKASLGLPFFKRNGEEISPPHGRTIYFANEGGAAFAACLLNSSLFYWSYSAFSDCEHINDVFVRGFPIPTDWRRTDWKSLSVSLSESLKQSATRRTITTRQGHTIEYDEIKASLSKPLIDGIDQVLAQHYGLTDEELDFVINYDIKYRMGDELFDEDEGDSAKDED